MASGKSTVGPLLADRMGYRFVDLDWLVEAQTGRSVPALFADGERVFRAAETAALRETTGGEGLVVSTGGGTLVDPQNLIVARGSGPVVWLRTSIEVLLRRVGDASSRPMLAGPDGRPLRGEALHARVADLLAAREPFYAQADLAIDADAAPDVVAREVAEALAGWRRGR
jgi:shikimate kinase